nr:uncharacterized protein LOC104085195 isoform X1 [Nicotiana tomentosiformis]
MKPGWTDQFYVPIIPVGNNTLSCDMKLGKKHGFFELFNLNDTHICHTTEVCFWKIHEDGPCMLFAGKCVLFKWSANSTRDIANERTRYVASEPVRYVAKEPVTRVASESARHVASEPVTHVASERIRYVASEPVTHVASESARYVASKSITYVASEPVIYIASEPVKYIANP